MDKNNVLDYMNVMRYLDYEIDKKVYVWEEKDNIKFGKSDIKSELKIEKEDIEELWEYVKQVGNKVAKTYVLNDGERYEVEVKGLKKEILNAIEEYIVWVLSGMDKKVLQKDKQKEEYGKIMIEYIKALQQSDGNNKSLAEELIKIVKEEEKRASRLIYFELLEIERGLRRINIYPLKSKLNTRKIIRSIDKVWR